MLLRAPSLWITLLLTMNALMSAATMNGCGGPRETRNQLIDNRASVERRLGLALPDHTSNLFFKEYEAMNLVDFVRFDLPSQELNAFLESSPRLSHAAEMRSPGHEQILGLGMPGLAPNWWQPGELPALLYGKKTGKYRANSGNWNWNLDIVTAPMSGDAVRVYILYIEEPSEL